MEWLYFEWWTMWVMLPPDFRIASAVDTLCISMAHMVPNERFELPTFSLQVSSSTVGANSAYEDSCQWFIEEPWTVNQPLYDIGCRLVCSANALNKLIPSWAFCTAKCLISVPFASSWSFLWTCHLVLLYSSVPHSQDNYCNSLSSCIGIILIFISFTGLGRN